MRSAGYIYVTMLQRIIKSVLVVCAVTLLIVFGAGAVFTVLFSILAELFSIVWAICSVVFGIVFHPFVLMGIAIFTLIAACNAK